MSLRLSVRFSRLFLGVLTCPAIPSGPRSSTRRAPLDAKRGKIFTRLIKELTVAARAGGGDPDMNPRLRTIIADAKAANMPADNIKRAIRRGTGEEPGVSYEEAQYEAYGPGGAAVIIDVLTDNKNRTVGELRHMLEKHGGNLAATNAVAWMFTKKGYIVVEKAKADEEKLMAAVLDAGADDLQDDGDNWEVLSAPEAFQAVRDAVKQLGIEPASAAGLDDSAELREARRQGRAADAEADGSARRSRRRAARLVELRHRGEGDRGLARVRVFGIDPGSERTGYGCVETDGSRHRIVACGAITRAGARRRFPTSCIAIHSRLPSLLAECRPDCVAIENLFYAVNARSALKLGHARGVAMLAAVEAGVPVVRVHAGRDQARGRRLRPRREAAGAADGQAAARPGGGAVAARRRRRAGRRDLPRALAAAVAHGRRDPAGSKQGRPAGGSTDRNRWLRVPACRSPMIAHLRGRILEKHPNRIVVDVNGVGYDVFVPLSTFYGLGEPGTRDRAAHPHARARGCARCSTASRRCSSRSCSSG